MQIIRHVQDWQTIRQQIDPTLSVGFVPTMGNLHLGHRSLMETCKADNDRSVVSIFVNPTQFDRQDDFTNYPKTLDADFALLEEIGIDYCWVPDSQCIYPQGYCYRIEETTHSLRLEGPKRPGHFSGVLTVVMILLQIAKAHRAYFGEKDYQQYQLIQGMANAFFLETKLVMCPTIREHTGLPYSSRNNRLNSAERALAEQFAQIFHQTHSCDEIHKALIDLGIKVDYIEEYDQRRFAAVSIGEIRLIDNYALPITTI